MKFGRLCEIDPDRPASWRDRLFLTLDLDWAHDAVIGDALDLVDQMRVPATVFVTHETPLLARMRANPALELGIHPNFNPLLEGERRYGGSIAEVLDHFLRIVPEARGARSHSLAISSPMLEALAAKGLRYESNTFIPWETGIALKPWISWNRELLRIPICWADDVHCAGDPAWEADRLVAHSGLRVLIFHPIHLFLNTERIDRYEAARQDFRDPQRLREHINTGSTGVRRLFAGLAGGR